MTQSPAPVWVGTCAWDKSAWQGGFYDKGVRRSDRLKFASRRLKTLEINATFHGPKSPKAFLSWHAQTPGGFIFSVKGHREVTHDQALRNPEKNVAAFLASGVLLLGEKLGPILWQIYEEHAFKPDVVDRFLATLPHSVAEAQELIRQNTAGVEIDPRILALPDRRIRHAFEARHASFGNATFIDMLRRRNVAAVFTNSPKWLELRELTSDFVYLRFHGDVQRYPQRVRRRHPRRMGRADRRMAHRTLHTRPPAARSVRLLRQPRRRGRQLAAHRAQATAAGRRRGCRGADAGAAGAVLSGAPDNATT